LIGKQLHWNVVGQGFDALHRSLDEFVDSWRELFDVVAERAAAIDVPPDGRITAVVEAVVGRVEAGRVSAATAVHLISAEVAAVAQNVRSRVGRVGELDPCSQDVLIEMSPTLEKQLWMLRAQLQTEPNS
jgi:starvation-inducible DNA-binding protein